MTDTTEGALIACISALAGSVISPGYQHFREWKSRPRLRIDYEGNPANRTEHQGCQYVRARVRNVGQRAATSVRVFITKIHEVQGMKLLPTHFYDSAQLAWAGSSFDARTLPAGIAVYVNVLKISKDVAGWDFCVEPSQEFAVRNLKTYSGTYRVELAATSDNASAACRSLDIIYNQDWHSLRASAT